MFLYLFLYCSNVVLVKISLESHSFRRLTEEMDRGRQRQCRPRVWRSAAYFHMMDVLGSMTMRVVEEREREIIGVNFSALPSSLSLWPENL